ncbi:MAG: nitroreductase [Lachnospiraceae bacterium]|nr:nitroreductase [Lachnospiraceae bacterium]
MNVRQLIKERHSVRKFMDLPIDEDAKEKLDELVETINKDTDLHIQMIYDEPDCFKSFIPNYGRFKNVNNYIALVGHKSIDNLEVKCGYYGEKIVLYAQDMGLNTCWVGGTFSRGKCWATISPGEKLVCVIAIGYGETEGTPHKSKKAHQLCNVSEDEMPLWFKNGLVAAKLAPTAMNQQKFYITLFDDEVTIKPTTIGPFVKTDLGIVKYHFEAVSGHECL